MGRSGGKLGWMMGWDGMEWDGRDGVNELDGGRSMDEWIGWDRIHKSIKRTNQLTRQTNKIHKTHLLHELFPSPHPDQKPKPSSKKKTEMQNQVNIHPYPKRAEQL